MIINIITEEASDDDDDCHKDRISSLILIMRIIIDKQDLLIEAVRCFK